MIYIIWGVCKISELSLARISLRGGTLERGRGEGVMEAGMEVEGVHTMCAFIITVADTFIVITQ